MEEEQGKRKRRLENWRPLLLGQSSEKIRSQASLGISSGATSATYTSITPNGCMCLGIRTSNRWMLPANPQPAPGALF